MSLICGFTLTARTARRVFWTSERNISSRASNAPIQFHSIRTSGFTFLSMRAVFYSVTPAAAMAAFSTEDADYIKTHGYTDEEAFAFWDYGVELSRRFRALKVWLTLQYYGTRRIAEAISDDISLAAYLGEVSLESRRLRTARAGGVEYLLLSLCSARRREAMPNWID